jgi:hypothetical protein
VASVTGQELRDQMRAILEDPDIEELDAALDALEEVVNAALHEARHTVNGRCRYCGRTPDGHQMRCRFYVGPLEHKWVRKGVNGSFGGIDHDCVCGGWFRLGGLAGHGDGTGDAVPVCPNADQDWRGPREGKS